MTIKDLLFTKDHEWIKAEGNEAIIGISDYAQSELGEIVFIELPSIGEKRDKEAVFGTVEAVKAVSDLFMPVSGEVIAVNAELEKKPELINEDPYEAGWMIRIKMADLTELETLMDAKAYDVFIK